MPRHAALSRVLTVAVLSVLSVLLAAAPAYAHTRLVTSDPADAASLATAPDRVTLTFDDNITARLSTITVIGPDGAAWHTGEVTANGPTISSAVRPLGPAGGYQIGYRVVGGDGHPVQGGVSFTLTVPGVSAAAPLSPNGAGTEPPTPATVTSAANHEHHHQAGPSIWPWLLGAVLVAGGAAVALARRARSKSS